MKRARVIANALGRIVLFGALFFVLHELLAPLFLRVMPGPGFVADTAAVLVAAVVVGVALLRFLEHRPADDLGFPLIRKAPSHLLVGLAIGAVGLLVACGLLALFGVLRFHGDDGTPAGWLIGIGGALMLLLLPAAAEEALFRGYPFQKLVEGTGPVLATLGASAVFAFAHANNPSVNGFALANIFAAGVMLSVAYLLTRSLWFATGVHLGWNWSMASLLDLPVSGLEIIDTPLYEPVDRGPAWLSGGAFGPEAGMAGLLGLLLVLGGVVWISRKTQWVT